MLLLVGFAKVNQHSHNRFIATYFHDAAKDFDAVILGQNPLYVQDFERH
jgi:hypothetical protein